MYEDQIYKKNYDRWYQQYIENLDLSQIKWIRLTSSELKKFYDDNYYDEETKCYALSTKKTGIIVSPFGMEITSYYWDIEKPNSSHILGIVHNNKGTYTIVSKIKINEHYKYSDNSNEYLYINYIETNSYFRNLGLYKSAIKVLSELFILDKDIITSEQTTMGLLCNTHYYFCKILTENGYQGKIRTESELAEELSNSYQKKLTMKN